MSEIIRYQCPFCEYAGTTKRKFLGRRAVCHECQKDFTITEMEDVPPPIEEDPAPPRLHDSPSATAVTTENIVSCPDCRGGISKTAIACPHCGHQIYHAAMRAHKYIFIFMSILFFLLGIVASVAVAEYVDRWAGLSVFIFIFGVLILRHHLFYLRYERYHRPM